MHWQLGPSYLLRGRRSLNAPHRLQKSDWLITLERMNRWVNEVSNYQWCPKEAGGWKRVVYFSQNGKSLHTWQRYTIGDKETCLNVLMHNEQMRMNIFVAVLNKKSLIPYYLLLNTFRCFFQSAHSLILWTSWCFFKSQWINLKLGSSKELMSPSLSVIHKHTHPHFHQDRTHPCSVRWQHTVDIFCIQNRDQLISGWMSTYYVSGF